MAHDTDREGRNTFPVFLLHNKRSRQLVPHAWLKKGLDTQKRTTPGNHPKHVR